MGGDIFSSFFFLFLLILGKEKWKGGWQKFRKKTKSLGSECEELGRGKSFFFFCEQTKTALGERWVLVITP